MYHGGHVGTRNVDLPTCFVGDGTTDDETETRVGTPRTTDQYRILRETNPTETSGESVRLRRGCRGPVGHREIGVVTLVNYGGNISSDMEDGRWFYNYKDYSYREWTERI